MSHKFRYGRKNHRSHATFRLINGLDLRHIQELIGYNTTETRAIYTHITDKMKSGKKVHYMIWDYKDNGVNLYSRLPQVYGNTIVIYKLKK